MQQLFALFPYSPALPTATITIAATNTAAIENTATDPDATATANTATDPDATATANTATANAANTAANTATSTATATYSSSLQKILTMTYHPHSDTHHRFLKAVYHAYGAQYQSALLSTLTPAPSTPSNPIYHISSA